MEIREWKNIQDKHYLDLMQEMLPLFMEFV